MLRWHAIGMDRQGKSVQLLQKFHKYGNVARYGSYLAILDLRICFHLFGFDL